jgi:DNA-binding NarL/FixJ family response regulator
MGYSILIIERYETLRDALRNWLEATFPTCRVHEAATLAEAINSDQREEIHVILMNGASPKIGEIEATREIKAAFPNIALIVLTTRECEGFQETILEAGAAACVPTWEITKKIPDILPGLLEDGAAESDLVAKVRASVQ